MAQAEIVRKAKPLLSVDLRDIAERLKPNRLIDARDGALLTVGWSGALRRCELVGLDWVLPADGTGFVTVDERGIVITLMTSKASQDATEQIVIPRGDMAADLRALEAWAALAGLQPRQRVFCPIDQQGHLSPKRSCATASPPSCRRAGAGSSIAEARLARTPRRPPALFSGRSLRAGYATSAAAKELPSYRIQAHTRYKSADMVQGYVRESDRRGKSGLKGVGF
jgi:integrase